MYKMHAMTSNPITQMCMLCDVHAGGIYIFNKEQQTKKKSNLYI